MKQNIFIEIFCFLLILLFVYAGISKFIDYKDFISDLNNQPFPNSWTLILSWLLPSSEIIIAISLFFNSTLTKGLLASILLMGAFTIYTALVLLRVFPYVPCSCGGVIDKLSWEEHFIFNLFFLFISIAALVMRKNITCNVLKYFMHENRSSRKPV